MPAEHTREGFARSDPLLLSPPATLAQLALALQMSLAEAQQPPKEEEKKE